MVPVLSIITLPGRHLADKGSDLLTLHHNSSQKFSILLKSVDFFDNFIMVMPFVGERQ